MTMKTGQWRDRLDVELGDWVDVDGVKGHVCGLVGGKEYSGAHQLDVCFRPHDFHGFARVDHRVFTAPFLGVNVLGKLDPPPFNVHGQETRHIDFGLRDSKQ